jgi:hypothetical protein
VSLGDQFRRLAAHLVACNNTFVSSFDDPGHFQERGLSEIHASEQQASHKGGAMT